ncbi:MAG TPA: DNA polymerase III subunit delta [Bacteroidia bacterium]|nr:DNA polymerase III subunit delta [Bacteroidia bacterium]
MLFQDVLGQQEVKKNLLQTVADSRISHAQLFLGKEGFGALPLAYAYAQYIHCTNKGMEDSCGVCPSCQKHAKLVHPDLHMIFPVVGQKEISANFTVEWRELFLENSYLRLPEWWDKIEGENKQPIIYAGESIDILRRLSFTAFESEYKIVVIWLPEKMHHTAVNRLLKVLEEPLDKTVFLLVCEDDTLLLPTIISRTQLVKVPAIADGDLRSALMKRFDLNEADAEKIAFQADGSFSVAKQIIEKNEQAIFNFDMFQKWMRACLKFDAPKVIACVSELAEGTREQQKSFLNYALKLVRESLIANYADKELMRIAGDEFAFISKFSPFIHAANGGKFIEELDLAHYHISRNGAPKLIFMDLSFKVNELLNVSKPQAV